MNLRNNLSLLCLTSLLSLGGCAGTPRPWAETGGTIHVAGLTVPVIPARPEDVSTIDGLLNAFYAVTNVAPTEPRQFARDRTLYVPDIKFVNISGDKPSVWDYATYVEGTEPMLKRGFKEHETHRIVRRYGNIAHVFSTYESEEGPDFSEKSRGVNSLELYFDGTRWWVTSCVWQIEDATHPIPKEMAAGAP